MFKEIISEEYRFRNVCTKSQFISAMTFNAIVFLLFPIVWPFLLIYSIIDINKDDEVDEYYGD